MGGLLSLIRDIKTVYRDLKITLKLSARIVLKVHGIVDDVEQTLQELKEAVKRLSQRISPTQDSKDEIGLDSMVENVESKAILLKTSLIEATSHLFNEGLLRSTQDKWDKVMRYSKQSSEAFANIIANSSRDLRRETANDSQKANLPRDPAPPMFDGKEEEMKKLEERFDCNGAASAISEAPVVLQSGKIKQDFLDFEVLPFEIVDSFWKCDIGCFNIDCIDFQHLPRSLLMTGQESESIRKKMKKRIRHGGRMPTECAKKISSSKSSQHVPSNVEKYNHPERNKSKENMALELIFLIAVLVEGAAVSNRDRLLRGNLWKEGSNGCGAAEIIELDD
ncbi:PREDICTED: uncharacterized protein LOC107340587 [Acropora digitifera]|uniref:uncharacterized protein LOC107340587 n=1 Tax=Acropora digitifera TaxID=70779 RepID=UPI00077A424B|nr:PREDICTED: uncharacterized protein LOC107340587 [Acropora digitifera]